MVYCKHMIQLAHATQAPVPRSNEAKIGAWAYTAVLVVMAVGQLFAFEKFIPLIASYDLPGGSGTASLISGLIVLAEVFAIPFLLRMPLSPLMRIFSMICSLVVPILWVKLALWTYIGNLVLDNSGMLGTKVVVPAGLLALAISIMLFCLSVWIAWGLQPAKKKR